VIGIAVSALAVFRAVGSLNGMVGYKACKLNGLRTESDEVTINLPVLSGVQSVSLMRLGKSESVMESGSAIVGDQWSRGRLRIGAHS